MLRWACREVWAVLLASVFVCPAVAQVVPASQPGGSVTGHVLFGDTRQPARLVQVEVFRLPDNVPSGKARTTPADEDDAMSVEVVMARTGRDGAFEVDNLRPGDYCLFGAVGGYLGASQLLQAAFDAGADPTAPLPGIARVHVAAGQNSAAELVLQRGGSIAGRLLWKDGTPVDEGMVQVILLAPEGGFGEFPAQFRGFEIVDPLKTERQVRMTPTNDQGRFRMAGLLPGRYLLRARVYASDGIQRTSTPVPSMETLEVWAPSALHRADATTITLGREQDLADQDITLDLDSAHSVVGRVTSAADHHPLASARVRLRDPLDPGFERWASVDSAGTYRFALVAPGSYELEVRNAADVEAYEDPESHRTMQRRLKAYAPGTLPVVVATQDVTLPVLELTPLPGKPKDEDEDELEL